MRPPYYHCSVYLVFVILFKTMQKFCILAFCTFSFINTFSQVSETWKKKYDRGNRYEGFKKIDVSAPKLEMVSFWSKFEKYDFARDDTLSIYFYNPEAGEVEIYGQEKNVEHAYWMQAKSRVYTHGIAKFSPWPTRTILKPYAVRPENLAVLAKRKGQDLHLPVVIVCNEKSLQQEEYHVAFRPAFSILGGSYEVIQKTTNKVVAQGNIGSQATGLVFSISFPHELGETGHYELKVKIANANSRKEERFYFSFFHLNTSTK